MKFPVTVKVLCFMVFFTLHHGPQAQESFFASDISTVSTTWGISLKSKLSSSPVITAGGKKLWYYRGEQCSRSWYSR